MIESIRPRRLRPGDTIAVLSPSWGGPAAFPHVFDLGLKILREDFGLKIKEFATARLENKLLHGDPRLRAEDLNRAFADPEVSGIFASIGGDDSIRILKYLDLDMIKNNPKVFMGFSDTTTLLAHLNTHGLVTFHGPSVMAGFSQMRNGPAKFERHIKEILFEPEQAIQFPRFEYWTDGYVDWHVQPYTGEWLSKSADDLDWQWLQGEGVVTGRLFGGNIEVLDFLKGTEFQPPADSWDGKIVFFETSEEKPSVAEIKYKLRNYCVQGVMDRIAGILFGRPMKYTPEEKRELERTLLSVVREEFGNSTIPIVANLHFGHTDPQWVLPLGVLAEIDCGRQTLRLMETAVL